MDESHFYGQSLVISPTKSKPFQIKGLSLLMLKIYFRNIMSYFSITQTTKGNKRTGLRTKPKETSPVLFAIQPRFGTCLSIYLVKTTFSEFVNEHVDGKDRIKRLKEAAGRGAGGRSQFLNKLVLKM